MEPGKEAAYRVILHHLNYRKEKPENSSMGRNEAVTRLRHRGSGLRPPDPGFADGRSTAFPARANAPGFRK